MQAERRLLGCLGAALGALPALFAARFLFVNGLLCNLAGLVGFLPALGGWRLLAGRCSGLGVGIAALLAFLAAMPGLYLGCADLILAENARFGCTMQEALELVPTVIADPYNLPPLLLACGGILVMDLLAAWLSLLYLRQKQG